MDLPDFNTKKELFGFLVENKNTLIAQKKAELKKADAVSVPASIVTTKAPAVSGSEDKDNVQVKVVINTTNLIDSHKDVHIPGMWDKSLSENKNIMHLQEHDMKFDKIISKNEDLKAYVQDFIWQELGYDFEGTTQALVFDSNVKKERNEFMFDQYRKGYVDQHSVGMMYVKLLLAINDEDYGAEYEAWEKYLPMVANKSTAEDYGYMWIVKEAKVIEGSSVVLGSNFVTPTLDIKQPPSGTVEQPSDDTEIIEGIKNIFKSLNY